MVSGGMEVIAWQTYIGGVQASIHKSVQRNIAPIWLSLFLQLVPHFLRVLKDNHKAHHNLGQYFLQGPPTLPNKTKLFSL